MKTLLLVLFVVIQASAQSISPAGIYTAGGDGTAGNITIDWVIGNVTGPPIVADLTPLLYARPSTIIGTTPITVVVDVQDLNSVATFQPITVFITKDSRLNLTLPTNATTVGGRPVQNSAWTFSANATYYILTTDQPIAADARRSFGLEGVLTPGATAGKLNVSAVIIGGSSGEVRINNNADADKIEYFQQ